jgi:hypothetical protein
MSANFKQGEVAILQIDPACTVRMELFRLNGEEVEVTGPLDIYITEENLVQYGYPVRHHSYGSLLCAPHELRRRKPPSTGEESVLALFRGVPQREGAPA